MKLKHHSGAYLQLRKLLELELRGVLGGKSHTEVEVTRRALAPHRSLRSGNADDSFKQRNPEEDLKHRPVGNQRIVRINDAYVLFSGP